MSSILGLDYGLKRTGVAIAHQGIQIASPLTVLDSSQDLVSQVVELASQEQANLVVVGLPRGLDGQETDQTRQARQFAAELEQAGLTIALQDEAATSVAVEEATGQDDQNDARAASLILSDYLQEQS